MVHKICRIAALILGFIFGFQLFGAGFSAITAVSNLNLTETGIHAAGISVSVVGGSVFGLIFYLITPIVIRRVVQFNNWIDGKLKLIPIQDIVLGTIGLIAGLSIAALLSIVIYRIPWVGIYLSLAVTVGLGYLGINIVTNRKEELSFITTLFSRHSKAEKSLFKGTKVLDTSVIIDGRIADICNTGFMEGTLVIPGFVLEELRHIADSSDVLKRNRGRRGLDILNKIQKELDIPVKIHEQDFEESMEVDSKLVKLAKVLKGKVVTNDYNLNKVCELQGVPVLNINELANALKPVVLPGEEMVVQIIKDGKEARQGIGYLDDGTMIVVDGGKKHINEHIEVVVTSVLQTAAGRMIFARPKAYMENIFDEVK